MNDYWYLVSSLPGLHLGEKPPMGAAAFRAACIGELSEPQLASIDAALENVQPPVGAATEWWNSEVQLRDAVVQVRAKNRSADSSQFIQPYDGFSVTIEKWVTDAFARSDPQAQEMELDRARWTLVEELAVTDPFGFSALLAFAVKVRIAERWAGMDEKTGQENVEELVLSALEELDNELTHNE